MSVINRMLEDLERRQARDAPVLAVVSPPGAPAMATPGPGPWGRVRWLLVLMLTATALYGLFRSPPEPRPAIPTPPPPQPPITQTGEPAALVPSPGPAGLRLAGGWSPDSLRVLAAAGPTADPRGAIAETHAALTPNPLATPADDQSGRRPDAVTAAMAPPAPNPVGGPRAPPDPAWELARQRRSPAPDGEGLLRQARERLRDGQDETAAELLRTALEQEPGHGRVATTLVALLVRMGRPEEALAVAEGAHRTRPDDPGLGGLLARQYIAGGRHREALEVLGRVLADGATEPALHALAAGAHQGAGDHAQALAAYRRALAAAPQDGRWWAGLAVSLEALGRSLEARGAYRRARAVGDLAPPLAAYVTERLAALEVPR